MKLQDNNMNLYEICYNDPLEADLKQKCQKRKVLSVLLLGYTDSSAATSGGLGVLSTNPEAPVMTKSPEQNKTPLNVLTIGLGRGVSKGVQDGRRPPAPQTTTS
jgi:hypothetical protein